MNKENAASFIPLVQALADGKTIQYNSILAPNPKWEDIAETGFIAGPEYYRIKPEPRVWTVRRNTCTGLITGTNGPELDPSETIRAREILD